MKLWLLKMKDEDFLDTLTPEDDPWSPDYDTMSALVVRASSELEARGIAHKAAMEENSKNQSPWLSPRLTDCQLLTEAGEKEVIIRDINWG